MTNKMLLTREDIIQALSNKDLKVALPKGFTIEYYKRPLMERIGLVLRTKSFKFFNHRTLKLSLDGEEMILFGVDSDFKAEVTDKKHDNLVLELNQDMFKILIMKETKDKLYKEIAKYLEEENK